MALHYIQKIQKLREKKKMHWYIHDWKIMDIDFITSLQLKAIDFFLSH